MDREREPSVSMPRKSNGSVMDPKWKSEDAGVSGRY